uniref:Mediator of RNA polymerase II transcription subunit 15 n=1 Tax=Arion vulgaris TaxID=1028688 RepID=A0A0B7AWJ3_9EUPU
MASTDSSVDQPSREGEDIQKTEEAPESDDWKTEKYRNKVVELLQDQITKTESQVPKSATDLELFVFSKATSRKSYMDLVTRILMYIAEFNKKMEKKETEESKADTGENGEEKKVDS